jgi:hypothetical protein
MMNRSRAGVTVFATFVSEGTTGEMPPFPCIPWHCEQANCTKSCAPAATRGSTCPPVATKPVAATVTVGVCLVE